MRTAFLTLIIIFLVFVGIVILQFFLSKRKSRLPGLILPAIFIAMPLSLVIKINSVNSSTTWIVVGNKFVAFIMSITPAVILIIIYIICRQRLKKSKELEKMNVQDLE